MTASSVRVEKRAQRAVQPVEREVRRFVGRPEVRQVTDAAGNPQIVVTGEAMVYEQPYTVTDEFGEFTETIHAGAATALLASPALDCRFLFNHAGMPLARTAAGTLTLTDTPTALVPEARLDARQQLANDLAIAIERGDVSQMSIGFVVDPGGDAWSDNYCTRDIWAIAELFDVSAVTFPASPTTSISVGQRSRQFRTLSRPAVAPGRVDMVSDVRYRRSMWAARQIRNGRPLTSSDERLLVVAALGLGAAAAAPDPEPAVGRRTSSKRAVTKSTVVGALAVELELMDMRKKAAEARRRRAARRT